MSWLDISRHIGQEITLLFEAMATAPLPEQLLHPSSHTIAADSGSERHPDGNQMPNPLADDGKRWH